MRFEIIAPGEKRLVGGNQRNVPVVGQVDQRRLVGSLRDGAVPLQLDIEAVAEQAVQVVDACGR